MTPAHRALVVSTAAVLTGLCACGEPADDVSSSSLSVASQEFVVADVITSASLDGAVGVPTVTAMPRWSSPESGEGVVARRAGVIAVFDDPTVALQAAQRIHAVLVEASEEPGGGADIEEIPHGAPSAPPPTPAERAFLAELGLAEPIRGFGWLGEDRASGPAVSVLGGVVTVGDLLFVDADDSDDNPLHDAFVALGASTTIGELDWVFVLGAAADVACTAPEPVPSEPLRELADYLTLSGTYDVVAPWDGPIDDEARRLRRAYRLLEERRRSAAQVMFDDPAEVARRIDESLRSGAEPAVATREAIGAEGSMDPAIFEGIDPRVVEWFVERSMPVDPDDEARVRAERVGELSAALGEPRGDPDHTGTGLGGRAVSVSWRIDLAARPATVSIWRLESSSLARTLPRLVDHLIGIGCTDVRIDVIDLDDG